jgi:hypothetical protein
LLPRVKKILDPNQKISGHLVIEFAARIANRFHAKVRENADVVEPPDKLPLTGDDPACLSDVMLSHRRSHLMLVSGQHIANLTDKDLQKLCDGAVHVFFACGKKRNA